MFIVVFTINLIKDKITALGIKNIILNNALQHILLVMFLCIIHALSIQPFILPPQAVLYNIMLEPSNLPLPDLYNEKNMCGSFFLCIDTYLIKGINSIKKPYEIDISNDIVCETHLSSILLPQNL